MFIMFVSLSGPMASMWPSSILGRFCLYSGARIPGFEPGLTIAM